MATFVSSGRRLPAKSTHRPVARRLSTPRCDIHDENDLDCFDCQRAVVFAVTARDRELREFRRLMEAPRSLR